MASAILDKFRRGSSDDPNSGESDGELANKYVLRVTAGPSYDVSTHKPVYVNSDQSCEVENEFITAKIKVRVRDYKGLPKGSRNHSAYFDDPSHAKDLYSIAFSFVAKKDIPSEHLVWGNDFDHPVRDRLPPGFNTAFKIVKEFIDPGLSCDAYADKPWLYGPALSCWFAFRVGEKANTNDFPTPDENNVMTEGADGSGAAIRQKLAMPEKADRRRKFYLDAQNRKDLTFEKGRCYQGDFFNPYLDFSNFALKLPGFSLGIIRYINDKTHHLRYVFKDQSTGNLLFCVVLTLLFGDELQEALKRGDTKPKPGQSNSVHGQHAVAGAANPNAKPKASPQPLNNQYQSAPPKAQAQSNTTPEIRRASKQEGVSEIEQMLKNTSTVDARQSHPRILTEPEQ